MKTEYVTAEQMRKALGKQTRTKKKPTPNPDIPRAASDERVGLTPLLVAGWSVESPDCTRYRLYQGARDTGMCATLKEACDKARQL